MSSGLDQILEAFAKVGLDAKDQVLRGRRIWRENGTRPLSCGSLRVERSDVGARSLVAAWFPNWAHRYIRFGTRVCELHYRIHFEEADRSKCRLEWEVTRVLENVLEAGHRVECCEGAAGVLHDEHGISQPG